MIKNPSSRIVYKLARFGAISIGIVYILIGAVALLSLMRVKKGGADESSILNMLDQIPFGRLLIALIFFGLVGYIVWKLYNAVIDPYGYGTTWKGWSKRLGNVGSGLAYGLIAYSAIEAFFGLSNTTDGQPHEQRLLVAKIYRWKSGEWIIAFVGLLVAITGIAQFIFVLKKGYIEKFSVKEISKTTKNVISILAWAGHFARGVILLVIAYFFIKSAIQSNPGKVVNTDKAFNFLGEQVGHSVFVLVAVGTICYGFYLFALSRYFDFENDFK